MKNLAAQVLRECITSGGDIAAHLNVLFNAPHSHTRSEMVSGALSELLRVYQAFHTAGYVARYDEKEIDAFMHATPSAMAATVNLKLNPVDGVWMSKFLGYLVEVVDTNREKLTFTNVEPAPAPAPIPVQIVGMPDRVIESKVTYDKDGNIASTTQTEKDAPALM